MKKKSKVRFEWVDMGDRIYLKVNGNHPPVCCLVRYKNSFDEYAYQVESSMIYLKNSQLSNRLVSGLKPSKQNALAQRKANIEKQIKVVAALFME